MKISYSWIKEFVDVKISPEKLADKLTMAGLSVASLKQVQGDWVYDIEVTSNRPDWLSVRGIVREVVVVTNARIKKSVHRPWSTAHGKRKNNKNHRPCLTGRQASTLPDRQAGIDHRQFSIHIEDTKDCSLYYGNLIAGIKAGPSPEWLKKRLEALGVRSVNNVVDITNYCLLEYGQPLHAFDFDKIRQSRIVVRRAKKGERLVLIDGSEKTLSPNVLVIADGLGPMAAAGIMGGRDTEVSSKTVNCMLESACFNPVVVRRGSRVLGIASDSSYRFERGVDIPTIKAGFDYATQMICDLCGGTCVSSKQSGTTHVPKSRKVTFSLLTMQDVLGININPKGVRNILEKLGFGVKRKSADIFEVAVPTYRKDVKIAEDITEEIARTYGYDKIPLTAPEIKPFSFGLELTQVLEPKIKKLLVSMGLKEVITYSLASEEDYKRSSMNVPKDALYLENPLSQDYHILRTTLVPSLLGCTSFNINHGNKDFEIFEMARIFGQEEERLSIGIVLSGMRHATWQKEARPYSLFDLKGILEVLLDGLQVKDYEGKPWQGWESFAAPGTACQIVAKEKVLASFGQTSEEVKRAWGIKGKEDIFVAEVFMDILAPLTHLKRAFKPISSTPSIFRDISVVTSEGVSYAKIKEWIERQAKGYLKRILLVDCYQGKEIPQGRLGLTISLEYGSDHKTLTDTEINPIHQGVLDCLIKDLSLTLR